MPIIDNGKCPTRTPKRDSRRSWHCGAVDSKSNFLACPHEQWAGSKPSLVISFSHISCSMVASLCSQSKSSKPTSIPTLGASLVRLPFCVGTAVPSESSLKLLDSRKLGRQEKTHENKISLYEHLRTPSEACPQRKLLRNESKGTVPPCTRIPP